MAEIIKRLTQSRLPSQPQDMNAVRSLLKLKGPSNVAALPDQRSLDAATGADTFELSELEQHQLQDETAMKPTYDRATGEGNPYGHTFSREKVRDSGMQTLRRGLGLDAREHGQQMEVAALKERGLLERARLMGKQFDRPYFSPVTVAGGVKSFDHRTGQVVSEIGDPKLSDTSQDYFASGRQILRDFEVINKTFDPRMVGPIAGRWNTIDQALAGEDPTMTQMFTSAQRIANQLLKIRSGSQVTDGEYARIAGELMDRNQPPTVFLERMKSAQQAFQNVYRDREQMAFGANRSTDTQFNPATAPTASGSRIVYQRDANGKLVRK